MILARRGDHHRLAHKAAKQRHGRDRERPHHVQAERDRHGLVEPAHLAQLSQPGHLQHSARAHEQQRLVKDVRKRVSRAPFKANSVPIPTPQTM